MIERDITLHTYGVVEPIRITYSTNEPIIRFWLKDYTLADTNTARVYNLAPNGNVYTEVITVNTSNNTLTFRPKAGLFRPGDNQLQIEISSTANSYATYSFIIPVICENNVMDDGDPTEASTALSAAVRAENAARTAANDAITSINSALALKTGNVSYNGLTFYFYKTGRFVWVRVSGTLTSNISTKEGYGTITPPSGFAPAGASIEYSVSGNYRFQFNTTADGKMQFGYSYNMVTNTSESLLSGTSLYFSRLYIASDY